MARPRLSVALALVVTACLTCAVPTAAQTIVSPTGITGTGSVAVPMVNVAAIGVDISGGGWSGTIGFFRSPDSTCATTSVIPAFQTSDQTVITTTTTNTTVSIANLGYPFVCIKGGTVTGTATVQVDRGFLTAGAGGGGGGGGSGDFTNATYNASFSTAGTPDTQVSTVQGITGMTPVQVQSNGANVSTEPTLSSLLTEVETLRQNAASDCQVGSASCNSGPQFVFDSMAFSTGVAFSAVGGDGLVTRGRGSRNGVGYVAILSPDGSLNYGTSTTPFRIDPTGTTTQPVSGTVTANAGTNLNTSALALEAGGNLAAIKTAVELIDNDQVGGDATAVITTASNNFTTARASPGRLIGVYLQNTTDTISYIRFYNDAAMVTGDCGSATNWVFSMPISPRPASPLTGGFMMPIPPAGIAFSTGVGFCITGGGANNDNTNAVANIYGVVVTK